jgi:phosphate transport system permease protein
MSAQTVAPANPALAPRPRPIGDPMRNWRLGQRVAYVACWAAGLALCAIAAAIVGYMAVKGAQYLDLTTLLTHPQPAVRQIDTGGILDPLEGTLILTAIALALAVPFGVVAALWVVEYGHPRWLARLVESGIEIVAGTPDVVLAIFGLAIFQLPLFASLSFTSSGGGVFGRSFIAAGIVLSLIALPVIFGSTREGLLSIPAQMREASWALGKTKICTIRTVLLPQLRRNIVTGGALGMGRIVGDTAIVILLLGNSLQLSPQNNVPIAGLLRGTGSTLTTYVYDASPAGEGNAPQKAYAAAFVLLAIVLVVNFTVDRLVRRGDRMDVGR